MSHTLILFRGAPGCGKTTLAKWLAPLIASAEHEHCREFCSDESHEKLYQEDGFHPEYLRQAHANCQRNVDAYMSKVTYTYKRAVAIVHNTFTQEWEMKPYLDMADKYGWTVVSLVVENRHGNKSVHDVPDEHVQKMVNRFEIKLT